MTAAAVPLPFPCPAMSGQTADGLLVRRCGRNAGHEEDGKPHLWKWVPVEPATDEGEPAEAC